MTMEQRSSWWDGLWRKSFVTDTVGADDDTWHNQIDGAKLKFLEHWLPSSGTAVEVGSGSARLLCRVGRRTAMRLVAIDNAPNALLLAHRTASAFGVKLESLEGDARALPLESGSVDLVLSGGLLEHFEEPRPVLAEMVRVLKTGGVFYADVVPRKLSLYRMRETYRLLRSPWLAPDVYESSFGTTHYRDWLEGLGVRDLYIVSCGVYPPFIEQLSSPLRRVASAAASALDGTRVANAIGWYFMIVGRKA
ncbi:MAG: hypothetical protein NVS3B20_09560 [Polyangiales bacterium]